MTFRVSPVFLLFACGGDKAPPIAEVGGHVISHAEVVYRSGATGLPYCDALEVMIIEELLAESSCRERTGSTECSDATRRAVLDEVVESARREPTPVEIADVRAGSPYFRTGGVGAQALAKNLAMHRRTLNELRGRAWLEWRRQRVKLGTECPQSGLREEGHR